MYQFGTGSQSGSFQTGWQQQQASNHQTSPTSQYPGYQSSSPAATQYQAAQYYSPQNQQYSQYPTAHQAYQGSYYQQPNYSQNTAQGYQHNQSQWYANSSQNSDASKAFQNTQTDSQNCYNCGNPGHWAQSCSEPRRAVPHGATNNPRPPKRQKTTGPVITRYPPPPNYNQRGPNRGYTHPPVGQPNYNQAQPYPGMPTPVSANDSTPNHWQQQSSAQQSPYSQQSGHVTPWAQGAAQTPVSQFSSPLSATGNPYHASFSTSPSNQLPTDQSLKRNSYDSSVQLTRNNSKALGSRGANHTDPETNDGPFGAIEQLEPWMEELQALDIPENKTGSSAIVWHPPNPVSQPLASTFDEAEAIGRLPIAAKLPHGMPISRYLQNKSAEEYEQNVRESPDWKEVQEDPGFAEIDATGPVVPFADLIARQRNLKLYVGDECCADDFDHNRENYDDPGEFDSQNHTAKANTSLHRREPSFQVSEEHCSAETDDAKCEWQRERQRSSIEVTDPVPSRSEAHAKTAAMQENDTPVEAPFSTVEKPAGSPADTLSRWPEKMGAEVHHNTQQSNSRPKRERSDSAHVYTQAQEALQGFADDHSENSSPPTSPRDGNLDNEASIETKTYSTNGLVDTDRHNRPESQITKAGSMDQSPSPLRSRHHASDNKKRIRYSSEENDGGAKRQLDDSYSRVKRRQPRVAEAYGRRW